MAGEKLRMIGSYFPDFAEWLTKSAMRAPDYVRTIEKQLDQLPDTAIRKACEQTLLDGDIVRWQKLPTTIYHRAKAYAAVIEIAKWTRVADGEETVCRLCSDTGYVTVLHPDTVAEMIRSGKPPAFPYQAVVACTCIKGIAIKASNARADAKYRRSIAAYDQRKHVLREIGVLLAEQYRQLIGNRNQHGW